MKLFNNNTKEIKENEIIEINNTYYFVKEQTMPLLNENGFYKVEYLDRPQIDKYQTLSEKNELIDNIYKMGYEVLDIEPNKAKELKNAEILESFINATTRYNGGIEVENFGVIDCGRDYLQNLQSLITILQSGVISEIDFRLYDNTSKNATLQDLQKCQIAMILKANELYAKKWQLESELENLATTAEIKALKVEF